MAVIKRACGAFLSISFALAGCTSVEKVLPQDGPTMLDIYESHIAASGTLTRRSPASASGVAPSTIEGRSTWREVGFDTELAAYTRTVESEIELLFPELPNPRIVMYVFPHLTGADRLPVPGYSTAFSMYDRAEFALPGEVAPASYSDAPSRDDSAEIATPTQRAVPRVVYGGSGATKDNGSQNLVASQ